MAIETGPQFTGKWIEKRTLLTGFFIFCMLFGLIAGQPAFAADTNGQSSSGSDKSIRLDFNKVDIRTFIKYISEQTGKNFIIDNKVKGQVTVNSPVAVSLDEAYHVFESVLDVHGYTTVTSGDYVKILPTNTARTKNVDTLLPSDNRRSEDKLVTQVIPLKYASSDEVKRLLATLISKGSNILSYPPTNTLIVTDMYSNIKRLMRIIKVIDVADVGQEITVMPLMHAEAKKFVKILSSIFKESGPTSTNKSRRTNTQTAKFVADERTNTIVVLASELETSRIKLLTKMLDKDVPRGKGSGKVHVYYLEHASAEDLAKTLQSLSEKSASASATNTSAGKKMSPVVSGNVKVTADKSTNSLIIMADKADYVILEDIIRKLDIPRAMVLIECLIMEVNVEKDFNLGTEWTVMGEATAGDTAIGVGGGFSGNSYANTALVAQGALPAGTTLGVFSQDSVTIGNVTFPNIGAIIQAYKKDRDVHILSAPHLTALDNETSEIYVGQNVPYQTKVTTEGDTPYTNYEYKNVGLNLKIEPQISKDRMVKLKINQEITKMDELSATGVTTPTTLKRTIDTSVVVEDGSTLVIGGLIDNSFSETRYRVPCLGDIPGLGWLFKTVGTGLEKTNLFVFITPHVLNSKEDVKAVYDRKTKYINTVKEGRIQLYLEKEKFEEAIGMEDKLFQPDIEDEASELETPFPMSVNDPDAQPDVVVEEE